MKDGQTTYLIWVYATYGTVSVVLTIWLARTLFKSGIAFLADVFPNKEAMAESVNRLLVTGFYMLNIGYACLLLRSNPADNPVDAIELLISKLGTLLVTLGIIHFSNMIVFWLIRRSAMGSRNNDSTAPLPPTYVPADAAVAPQ